MRTVRCSGLGRGGVSQGVTAWEAVSAWGGVSAWGVYAWGVYPSMHWGRHPPL